MTRKETSFPLVLILHVFLCVPFEWLKIHMTRKETSFSHVLILNAFLGVPYEWLNIHMTRNILHVLILFVF